MFFSRKIVARAALSIAGLCAAVPAWAWPDRPIELVVGFAPGGGTDLTARALAVFLEKELGATVVVQNKPGASSAIALAYVARAKPDGYTLAMTNMPGLVSLPIERKPGFGGGDFTYLANLVRDPSAFSVASDSPYQTLDALIAAAREKPGSISYGSTGVGTDDHLALVLFQAATGTRLNHVPYNGAGPLRSAVLGGHTVIGGLNLGEVMPYHGKNMRVLAQASEKRSALGPDVPTFKEQGVDLVFASERGIVAACMQHRNWVHSTLTALLTERNGYPSASQASQLLIFLDGGLAGSRLTKEAGPLYTARELATQMLSAPPADYSI